MSAMLPIANFILGGTEKAGTTSVFTYLSEHPQVCASIVKETDFFRRGWSGDRTRDLQAYGRFFPPCPPSAQVIMEASPGYLGLAREVAPRIAALNPQAKLLFILRDPVERLYSSYHFHVGKLNIPEAIGFPDYVDKCIAYDSGAADADALEMDTWYLDVLRFGRYADFLAPYYACFPSSQVKVMFYEQLRDDVHGFMNELSDYLNIAPDFWMAYEFNRTNVTFSSRSKWLHRLAIIANARLERALRRRPHLKARLVGWYKRLNQAREGYEPMSDEVRMRLEEYYRPANCRLLTVLGNDASAPDWCFEKTPNEDSYVQDLPAERHYSG